MDRKTGGSQGDGFGRLRLLVVDDDVMISRTLVRGLSRIGWEPACEAGSGAALKKLAEEKFDVLLIDFQMPDLNGMEIAGRLRDLGWGNPIILMTGRPDLVSRDELKRLDVKCLPKPFDMETLKRSICCVLRKQEKSR
jgi:DNA-binding response OmpR family regulator